MAERRISMPVWLGSGLFWSVVFHSALLSLGISGVVGAISLLLNFTPMRKASNVAAGAGISFLVNTILIWFVQWFIMPAQTGSLWGYAWMLVPIMIAGLIQLPFDFREERNKYGHEYMVFGRFGGGTYIAIAVVGALFLAVDQCTVRSQDGADHLASLVEVVVEPAEAYPDTDTNHMVLVPEKYAKFKAGQYIATQAQTDTSGVNISTSYRTSGEGELQSVQNHLYWIFALDFTTWSSFRKVGNISPGYIVVDAEDPDAEPQIKTEYRMKYTTSAYHSNELKRQLYHKHGYRDYHIDDLSLEVDDDWRPFYTATLNKKTLHNGGGIPVKMIIIDPETGKVDERSLDDIPEWVDRVYSASRAKSMMNWWGEWGHPETAPFKRRARPKTDRYKVTGDPNLVYTSSGHPAWQMTMTSLNKDDSVVYLVLFDARDNKARIYETIKGTPTERSVEKVLGSISQNVRGDFKPSHLALHKIYGQPTWVATYLRENDDEDDESSGETIVGFGLVSARSASNATLVAYGESFNETLSSYRRKLAQTNSPDAPGENLLKGENTDGVIQTITTRIENGDTVYLFILNNDPTRIYKAPIDDKMPELAFAKTGDKVVVTYIDVGENPVDVTSFNDLSLPMTP